MSSKDLGNIIGMTALIARAIAYAISFIGFAGLLVFLVCDGPWAIEKLMLIKVIGVLASVGLQLASYLLYKLSKYLKVQAQKYLN